MRKYEGEIVVGLHCAEYNKLSEAYRTNKSICVKTDNFSGKVHVLNIKAIADPLLRVVFTVRSI